MKQICFRTAVAFLLFAAPIHAQSRQTIVNKVAETSAWRPSSAAVEYQETNIGQLSSRIAPAATRYGVAGVTVQEWQGPTGNARTTLYEMMDTAAAYGLFTWLRNAEDPAYAPFPVGAEGFRMSNGAMFWQSKYVVAITGSAAATTDLGRVISENIFGQSRKPPVSEHLPPNHLIPGTDKYILNAATSTGGLASAWIRRPWASKTAWRLQRGHMTLTGSTHIYC